MTRLGRATCVCVHSRCVCVYTKSLLWVLTFLCVRGCVSAYSDLLALSFEGVVALLWVWFPRLLGHFVTHTLALPMYVCALLMCVCALLMNASASIGAD